MNYRSLLLVMPLALLSSVAARAHVEEMKTVNDLRDTLKNHENVVIKIFAHWCGHCQHAAQPFMDLSEEHKDHIKSVEIDHDNKALQFVEQKFGVTGFPTFVFIKKESTPGYQEITVKELSDKPLFIKKEVGFSLENLKKCMKQHGMHGKKKAEPTLKHKRAESEFAFEEAKTMSALKKVFARALDNDKYVVLEVGTEWCHCCKDAAPKFKELMHKYHKKMLGVKLDGDIKEFSPLLGKKFNIHNYPSFVIIRKDSAQGYEAIELTDLYSSKLYFAKHIGFTLAFRYELEALAEVPGSHHVVVKTVAEGQEEPTKATKKHVAKKPAAKKAAAKKHFKKPVKKHVEEPATCVE